MILLQLFCKQLYPKSFNFQPISTKWKLVQYIEMQRKNVSNPKRPNFGVLYFTQFLTDFGQILDSKSYDQAQQTL